MGNAFLTAMRERAADMREQRAALASRFQVFESKPPPLSRLWLRMAGRILFAMAVGAVFATWLGANGGQ